MMQSIFGALLTAGYVAAATAAVAASREETEYQRPGLVQEGAPGSRSTRRRGSGQAVSRTTPAQITAGARADVPRRRSTAPISTGIVAIVIGAALVFFLLSGGKVKGMRLLESYHTGTSAVCS